jgi:succinoglycan biosynthesis transport protein ExoP
MPPEQQQKKRPQGTANKALGAIKGRTLDPIRVLRQHIVGIVFVGILGSVIGVGAFFALSIFYPLYHGQVYFEVRAGLDSSTDIGTANTIDDKVVTRIANTQAFLMKGRDVLTAAVMNRDVRETTWLQGSFIDQSTKTVLVEQAVDDLEEWIGTFYKQRTNLFGIGWWGHDSGDVPIILNAIAGAYMKKIADLDAARFAANEDLFDKELRRTRLALNDLGDEIQAFIRSKGIQSLDDPQHSQASYEVQQLTTSLTEARSSFNIVQTQYLQIASKIEGTLQPSMDDVVEAELDPSLRRALETIEILRAEQRILLEKYHPSHSQIRQVEITLRAQEDQRDAKMTEIMERNLNARLKTLSSSRDQMATMIGQMEGELEGKDVELAELTASQSHYDSLETQRNLLERKRDQDMQLLKEIQLMKLRADAGQVAQTGPALEPREKSFPLPEVIIPVGMLICLGLFLALVFLKEITDSRIRSVSDLEIIPGAEVLGAIPEIEEDPTDVEEATMVARDRPDSVTAETYRQTWLSLERVLERSGLHSVLFASGLPGSGTTTIVGNLAMTAAAAGAKVLAVDANFRRPGLASSMGLSNDAPGLGDILGGAVPIEDVLHGLRENLQIIGAGTPSSRIIERFNGETFKAVLAQWRAEYDVVLIDAPPAVVAGDARSLAFAADAVVIVVRAQSEVRGLVARLIRDFSELPADVVGLMLNRPRGMPGGYLQENYETMAHYATSGSGDADGEEG